jgi:hypothetical protein
MPSLEAANDRVQHHDVDEWVQESIDVAHGNSSHGFVGVLEIHFRASTVSFDIIMSEEPGMQRSSNRVANCIAPGRKGIGGQEESSHRPLRASYGLVLVLQINSMRNLTNEFESRYSCAEGRFKPSAIKSEIKGVPILFRNASGETGNFERS